MSSLWEELQQEVTNNLSKSGPILRNAGRKLGPSSSVMDSIKSPTEEELKRTEAEKDAIGPPTVGPISIDPTDYITPGGLTKIGAALLKGVSALKGAALVGAFRSADSSVLSRETVEDMSNLIKWSKEGLVKGWLQRQGELSHIQALLISKLTNKELSKYGTPEFAMDPWLSSTIYRPGEIPYELDNMTANALINSPAAQTIRTATRDLNIVRASRLDAEEQLRNMEDPSPELVRSVKVLKNIEDKYKDKILSSGTLVEDFLKAQKEGKTLFHTREASGLRIDIDTAADNLASSLANYNIDSSVVEKKSLPQIVSIVKKKDEEILKALQKNQKAKEDIISNRTAELFNSQKDPNAGMFVQLETPQDLAQETDILNHCIGAVGRDNDKYIPAYDTITGKPNPKYPSAGTGFQAYKELLNNGESSFYSYRPNGIPEITLEVRNKSDWSDYLEKPYIKQAYGKEDAPLTEDQIKAVSEFADKKNFRFNPERWAAP